MSTALSEETVHVVRDVLSHWSNIRIEDPKARLGLASQS